MKDTELFDALCRENLYFYMMRAFEILHPSQELELNWHLECIAEHLTASYRGELPRLIINMPPRCLKSETVAQIYPSWVLGKEPQEQFIGASYAHSLAERNVSACRRIMKDDFYLKLFPNTRIEISRQDYFTTTKSGQYKGTGIGGTVTGFGCFTGDTMIDTTIGRIKIKDIGAKINNIQCLSFNHDNGMTEYADIEAVRVIKSSDLIHVTLQDGTVIECTKDHRIYVKDIGYIEAQHLIKGQVLVKINSCSTSEFSLSFLQERIYKIILRIRKISKKRRKIIFLFKEMFMHTQEQGRYKDKDMCYLFYKVSRAKALKLLFKGVYPNTKKIKSETLSKLPRSVLSIIKQKGLLLKGLFKQAALKANARNRKLKIHKGKISELSIPTNEEYNTKKRWVLLCKLQEGFRNNEQKSKSISSSYRRRHKQQLIRQSCGSLPYLPRTTSQVSEARVEMVKPVCKGSQPVYDLQIKGNHNFFANGVLVHNCGTLLIDDPQNPNEANSPTVRATTNQEIRQTLFSRFNDKRTGKLIMIMQRLHDDDATGNLAKDGGYFVLKLPAETKTHIHIQLGEKSWDMQAEELLTPRLPREALNELRIDLQELGYAGQYLQSPIPIGGGEFRKEWYQFYEPKTKKRYGNIYILCDAAGGEEMNRKKKKTSDWTAFVVVELAHDNNYYLLDIVRDRLNPTERVEMLFTLHRKWNSISGKAPKVGYEKYGIMTDTHYIKVRQGEEDYRFPIVELGGQMMKEERIRRIIPDMQRGRWYFPHELIYIDGEGRRFDLIKELLDGEFATFPRARFDDMSDALARIKDSELGALFPQIEVKPLYKQQQEPDNWLEW